MIHTPLLQPHTKYTVQAHEHQTFMCDIQVSQPEQITLTFMLKQHAQAHIYFICIGMSADIEINLILDGEHAQVHMHGLYVLRDTQKIKIITRQEHKAKATTSSLIVHGLLNDAAQAFYHGTIAIEAHAPKSKAVQENKNILLSSLAQAISMPSLEVLTNDVNCKHGSAVGKFDAQQLFYIQSRGLSADQAQRLMIEGFFAQIVASLNNAVVSDIYKRIAQQL